MPSIPCPPPSRTHTTTSVPPTEAQTQLATFLTRTIKQPHLHPDSILSSSGISFSATAGPNGGLALHHLRRIEAGLRGESLVAETREELAKFTGEDVSFLNTLGEDIGGGDQKEKKPLKSSLKRRREDRVNAWDDGTDAGAAAMHTTLPGPGEAHFVQKVDGESDWQDKEKFDREQKIIEGEVGERDGAPVVQQTRGPPALLEHDEGGHVDKRPMTEKEKAARKAAKKARNKAMQAEKRKC